ncbi:helix-turn-helix domain-containing protein, partial [Streptomyces lavendulae]|uniref:helix-turn-helix domain-containing protein n=1 Tax=Streptomyces lavendulae TaxID=1914 RepID=UPI0004CBB48D
MVKQERAVRTRRAVLEAAAQVIGTRGYEAATMAEIIQRAGVTKGLDHLVSVVDVGALVAFTLLHASV